MGYGQVTAQARVSTSAFRGTRKRDHMRSCQSVALLSGCGHSHGIRRSTSRALVNDAVSE